MSFNIGPQRGVRQSFGRSARPGWGLKPVTVGGPGKVLTLEQARARIRELRSNIRNNAKRMLTEAGNILADQWRENIAAENWGPGGEAESGDEKLMSVFARHGLDVAQTAGGSTGRYYNSIAVEVADDLEVHVGSTIPRPSGRGLRRWSYPEILEYGSSQMAARPTFRPAIDTAGPKMIARTEQIHRVLIERVLMK